MRWYYRWKLKRIRKEIHVLEDLSRYPLTEDYTANSRLRILNRLATHLQDRLEGGMRSEPNSASPS